MSKCRISAPFPHGTRCQIPQIPRLPSSDGTGHPSRPGILAALRVWGAVCHMNVSTCTCVSGGGRQCATFTGIAPGEQPRGGPKTIKFGINTKNPVSTVTAVTVAFGTTRRKMRRPTLPKRPAPVDFGPGAPEWLRTTPASDLSSQWDGNMSDRKPDLLARCTNTFSVNALHKLPHAAAEAKLKICEHE